MIVTVHILDYCTICSYVYVQLYMYVFIINILNLYKGLLEMLSLPTITCTYHTQSTSSWALPYIYNRLYLAIQVDFIIVMMADSWMMLHTLYILSRVVQLITIGELLTEHNQWMYYCNCQQHTCYFMCSSTWS